MKFLGLLLAAIALLASCRATTAPTPLLDQSSAVARPLGEDPVLAPELRHVRGLARHHELVITAQLAPHSITPLEPYDWYVLVWLDTDQNPATGYDGWDYFTGYETRAADLASVYHHSGPLTGAVEMDRRSHQFVITVPLLALGNDDGAVDGMLAVAASDGSYFAQYRFTSRATGPSGVVAIAD